VASYTLNQWTAGIKYASTFYPLGLRWSMVKELKKTAFKMLKKWTKILWYTSDVHPQSSAEKKDIFCGLCKKTKNCHIYSNFGAQKIVIFTLATKYIFLSRNFVSEHKMSRYILSYFFGILSILKYVF
jgi:hypothetical protein